MHELLAVEGDLAGTAKKLAEEARDTFAKKPTHFQSAVKAVTYFDDQKSNLNRTEQTAMAETVGGKLKYLSRALASYYDVYAAKEATNQTASADIVIDGEPLFKAVPATVLLGMETKLKELRTVYEAIPTLQPGVIWEVDAEAPGRVYKTKNPGVTFTTEKVMSAVVLAEATKEHKAQVKEVVNDVPVARVETTHKSGMITPADKSMLLGRLDSLIRATKEARQRANSVDAVTFSNFGKELLAYINGDLVT